MAHVNDWPAIAARASTSCCKPGLRRCWRDLRFTIYVLRLPSQTLRIKHHVSGITYGGYMIETTAAPRTLKTWPLNWALICYQPWPFVVHSVLLILVTV